ncbi:O-methyltransferase [soil metagenome]
MEFIDEELLKYTEEHSDSESEVLKLLNRETNAKVLFPRMISGHLQGRFLSMISHMIKPQFILEIGTYTGYSAICLAEGLQPHGKLITIDINDELTDMVKTYLDKAGLLNRVDHLTGDAMKIIPELKTNFDLVFIDADKENYCNYFEMVIDKVNHGGYIIADNVLWSGNVIKDEGEHDRETKGIIAFNEMISKDERVSKVMLPLRDGLYLLRKL